MDKTLSHKAANIDRILSKADSIQATYDGSNCSITYNAAKTAIDNGRDVTITYNGRNYIYSKFSNNTLFFVCADNNLYYITATQDGWQSSTRNLVFAENGNNTYNDF